MVAVVTRERILIASGVRDIEKTGSGKMGLTGGILRGAGITSRA
jgi:hypothetical protein